MIEVEPGVSLHVQDLGEGPTVVLVAGFGLSHEVWDGEVNALTQAGYRTVCIDLRGTGGSDKPIAGYDVARLSADLVSVLEQLDVRNASLVGWSFGGQVSLHAVAMAPERFSRLILVNSSAVRASRSETYPFGPRAERLLPQLQAAERAGRIPARQRLLEVNFPSSPDPRILGHLLAMMLAMPSWSALASLDSYLTTDLTHIPATLSLPVVIIAGDSDPSTPLAGARWLDERLAHSQLVTITGCGHYPMFEAPERFRAALLEAVAS